MKLKIQSHSHISHVLHQSGGYCAGRCRSGVISIITEGPSHQGWSGYYILMYIVVSGITGKDSEVHRQTLPQAPTASSLDLKSV